MSSYIQFEDVFFSYDVATILREASFTIKENDYVGIIGPNGGGKTTLLRLIMGFIKPTKGKITVAGTSPKNARKKMGYVPQVSNFDRSFPISVLDVVLMGKLSHLSWIGSYSKQDIQEALEVLDKVGLLHYRDKSFGTLSGGQAQRVLIARALLGNPELLLLDEPTASIDVETEAHVLQLLKDLKHSMTILMVTHDIKTIMHDVDKVLCVQNVVSTLMPEAVCTHFGYGLYHVPLLKSTT